MTWTQAVVPLASRGRFFAWRNLFAFLLEDFAEAPIA
jgi:hypothetical protein